MIRPHCDRSLTACLAIVHKCAATGRATPRFGASQGTPRNCRGAPARMLESLAMNLSPSRRAATAWMLYLCILSNLVVCALDHGQSAGLQLSGFGGLFCSASGNAGPSFGDDLAGADSAQLSSPFSCALCGTAVVSLGLLFMLAWLLRPTATSHVHRAPHAKAPPRYCWPAANPRASPLF